LWVNGVNECTLHGFVVKIQTEVLWHCPAFL